MITRPSDYQHQAAIACLENGDDVTDCRRCGQAIALSRNGRWWFHVSFKRFTRGCRAASFDRHGDWDDTLDRKWYAAPPRA